jgi:hypothetical protein
VVHVPLQYLAATGVPPYGQLTNTGPRKRRRSFRRSFHQPLLGSTGAYWLDGPPDLSCKESTGQYAVDDPLLSCNRLFGRIPGICATRTRRGSLVPP